MVDCERWTLTHSSGWAGGLVLALALGVTLASRDAVVWDDGDTDGELVSEGEAGGEVELDAEGELDAEVESDALGEGDGEGEGLGLGLGEGVGVGVGVGEGVLDGGSAWHVVVVFALALVDVPGLGVAEARLSPTARAEPGMPTSKPRARRPPASTLSAITRTCAKLIKSPCLRCSSGLLSALRGFGGD